MYVGGSFTSIGGQTRNRIAAINISDGLATSWNPNASGGEVDTIVLSPEEKTAYIVGQFTNIGGQARNRVAALALNTGQASTWDPNANDSIKTISLTSNGATLYFGGLFQTLGPAGSLVAREYLAQYDSPTIYFTLNDSEGSEGTSPANIEVSLSEVNLATVSVGFAAISGSAQGGGVDYTLPSSPLIISPNQTTANISVTINNDSTDEPDEVFILELSNPKATSLAIFNYLQHTFHIVDNDSEPAVDFTLTVSTGNEATTPANIQLRLSAASGKDVDVTASVTGGTATGGGVDYTFPIGVFTISAGQTTANIPITIINDGLTEAAETIEITISGSTNSTLGTNTVHIYTITDI